jgi:hypothetical protein
VPKRAVLLVVPLVAVAVLAGAGLAANLDTGARAVRVRGLASFEGTLTVLVHELQRERWLSERAARPDARLTAARAAVDRAAVAYRDATVRLDVSDRDRQLHQRLDEGLSALAALERRRAQVDGKAPEGPGRGGPGDPGGVPRSVGAQGGAPVNRASRGAARSSSPRCPWRRRAAAAPRGA